MYIVLCTPLTAVAQDTNYIETLYPNGTVVNNLLAKQEMRVQSLGQEDALKRNVIPLQFSCLGNPKDEGTWWATVHGVTNS